MTRYLVVYYSWTGNTKSVAKVVADRLGADLEEIGERHPYAGSFARLLHALDSIIRRKPPIMQARHDVRDYDVIILGSPVWAASMAAPMRSFLVREKGRISHAAFFCTQGGLGGETALESMARVSGAEPLSVLLLNDGQLQGSAWKSSVETFAQSIANATSTRQLPGEATREASERPSGHTGADHKEKVGDAPR